ncbi:biotin carboxylase N-terminal domain-containing protein [Halomonas cerina]|uniref:Biotin carboxylase n=1 Tax=Halomonas cerina TaxID=447424 RepID=A0A839V2H9_9GAMM|nr:biotin carboxylase N-terminal domain-containing protein [Halomonas cerina]MBB3189371.1 biotin carboxylase [Halomonas cerina]
MPADPFPVAPRLLVAGHGLDSLRVLQACRELGLEGLEADAGNGALMRRALASGCEALHPGESGASRQVSLAKACQASGLTFLGPRAALLEAMTDGRAMRQLMREAGLPLVVRPDEGKPVRVPVLADAQGRTISLMVRHAPRAGQVLAPVAWLTHEQRAYLGRLAVQGVKALGLVGGVGLTFRVAGNRIGFVDMAPGLDGDEAIDEVLLGLDPVITQLRLARGERLRVHGGALEGRGHARLWRLSLPPGRHFSGGPGLRLDRVERGGPAHFLAWGRSPEELLSRARRGLEELVGHDQACRLLS